MILEKLHKNISKHETILTAFGLGLIREQEFIL